MKTITLVVLISASALANAYPDPAIPPVEYVGRSSAYFLVPAVGKIIRGEVGESLYQEGLKTTSRTYQVTLKADATSKMDMGYLLKVSARHDGPMMMRPNSSQPMLCGFTTSNTGFIGFFGDRNVRGCLVDTRNVQAFDSAMFPGYAAYFPLSNPVPYDTKARNETTVENRDDFYVDVLYQGVSKGEVKISYREFSSGLARPAFTQDVTYELSKDGTATIGFKGMRIKVLKATGESIEYILEQPMPSLTKYRPQASQIIPVPIGSQN